MSKNGEVAEVMHYDHVAERHFVIMYQIYFAEK